MSSAMLSATITSNVTSDAGSWMSVVKTNVTRTISVVTTADRWNGLHRCRRVLEYDRC
jgi:hypothetical protein